MFLHFNILTSFQVKSVFLIVNLRDFYEEKDVREFNKQSAWFNRVLEKFMKTIVIHKCH